MDSCDSSTPCKFQIEWMIRFTECNEVYSQLKENSSNTYLERFFTATDEELMFSSESYIAVQRSQASDVLDCASSNTLLMV